jgi:hypothetical protein
LHRGAPMFDAGVNTGTPTLGDEAGLREELELNYLGPVAVSRAFAPVLGANLGGDQLPDLLGGVPAGAARPRGPDRGAPGVHGW